MGQVQDIRSKKVLVVLQEIQRITGRIPIIYVNNDIVSNYFHEDTLFEKYPLWLAYYEYHKTTILKSNSNAVPKPWRDKEGFSFWQKTPKYLLVADSKDTMDFDIFNGSEVELNNFINQH